MALSYPSCATEIGGMHRETTRSLKVQCATIYLYAYTVVPYVYGRNDILSVRKKARSDAVLLFERFFLLVKFEFVDNNYTFC